jgi:16S rRNA (guanine527-N7)-methyltransferase
VRDGGPAPVSNRVGAADDRGRDGTSSRGSAGGAGAAEHRAPLPTDPAACPALGDDFGRALAAGLHALDLDPRPGLRAGIEAQVRLLLAWNAAINLTAIRDPAAIAIEHVADALTAVTLIRSEGPERPALLDFGSGAGYPGLPLGLAISASRLTLVDSVGKKARFLGTAGAAAIRAAASQGDPVPTLEVVAERAETVAADPRHRGRYDLVTVRAVGPLVELVELGLPFLRPGGRLVAWKGMHDGRLADELTDAERLLPRLGGVLDDVEPVNVPGLEDHRLVVVRSQHPTPFGFPRSPTERRRSRARATLPTP